MWKLKLSIFILHSLFSVLSVYSNCQQIDSSIILQEREFYGNNYLIKYNWSEEREKYNTHALSDALLLIFELLVCVEGIAGLAKRDSVG